MLTVFLRAGEARGRQAPWFFRIAEDQNGGSSVSGDTIGSTPETGANWLRYSSLKAIAAVTFFRTVG
jgi:hypothetical protein